MKDFTIYSNLPFFFLAIFVSFPVIICFLQLPGSSQTCLKYIKQEVVFKVRIQPTFSFVELLWFSTAATFSNIVFQNVIFSILYVALMRLKHVHVSVKGIKQ